MVLRELAELGAEVDLSRQSAFLGLGRARLLRFQIALQLGELGVCLTALALRDGEAGRQALGTLVGACGGGLRGISAGQRLGNGALGLAGGLLGNGRRTGRSHPRVLRIGVVGGKAGLELGESSCEGIGAGQG